MPEDEDGKSGGFNIYTDKGDLMAVSPRPVHAPSRKLDREIEHG